MAKKTRKTIPAIYENWPEVTRDGKARVRKYQLALGRFCDRFARVEAAVASTLWRYAGTPPAIAKIVFAGVRVDGGAKLIKQIAQTTNAHAEKRKNLDYVLQQLGIINGVRNDILHYGATSVAAGAGYVTNETRAKGEPTRFPISSEALDQMTEDLRKIILHLMFYHLERRPIAPANVARIEAVLRRPWLYKHPQPPKRPAKTKATRPAPKRGQ